MYFPHGFLSRFQYDLMGVMDDPVAYGVRQGGVSYDVVPGVDGELGRYDGGARPIPVLHDLQDVPPLPVCKGVYTPVVNNEELHPLYLLKELRVRPVRPRDPEVLHEPGQPHVEGPYPLSHGTIPQCTREERLAGPGGTDDDNILIAPYPVVLGEPEYRIFAQAPSCPEVDIFEAGVGVTQMGLGEEALYLAVLPVLPRTLFQPIILTLL